MDFQELTTLAAKTKKPSKKCAQNLIKTLLDTPPTIHDLAELYAYFIPALPKVAKTPFEWVCKAVSNDARQNLKYPYSDGKNLIATNGHIMFVVPTILQKGYYDLQGNAIDWDHTFPEWQRLLPEHTSTAVKHNVKELVVVKASYNTLLYGGFKNTDKSFNKKYIEEIINGAEDFEIQAEQGETIAKINTEFGYAVIMSYV